MDVQRKFVLRSLSKTSPDNNLKNVGNTEYLFYVIKHFRIICTKWCCYLENIPGKAELQYGRNHIFYCRLLLIHTTPLRQLLLRLATCTGQWFCLQNFANIDTLNLRVAAVFHHFLLLFVTTFQGT